MQASVNNHPRKSARTSGMIIPDGRDNFGEKFRFGIRISTSPVKGKLSASVDSFWFKQFIFCAVHLTGPNSLARANNIKRIQYVTISHELLITITIVLIIILCLVIILTCNYFVN